MAKLQEIFNSWLEQHSDPRVRDWFLMTSLIPTIAICASYLIAAKFLHFWMKPRVPISIRWPIWSFDFFHLLASASVLLIIFNYGLLEDFNVRCQPLDKSPHGDKTVSLAWWYFLYNFTFFSEIFVFLLGKRHDKITKYFLFHHIALPISIWFIVKLCPTGHSVFFAVVNCAVHVASFGYLSLIGAFPGLKKHFWWWKRFFHSLLILRIFIIVLHAVQLFLSNDCNYPMVYPSIVAINAPFFIGLTIYDHLLGDRRQKRNRDF